MPTTKDEAQNIMSISQEYLTTEQMVELYTRLNNEVGKKTDNDSLKQSLAMMEQLGKSALAKTEPYGLFMAMGSILHTGICPRLFSDRYNLFFLYSTFYGTLVFGVATLHIHLVLFHQSI